MVSADDIVILKGDANPFGKLAIVVAPPAAPNADGTQPLTVADPNNGSTYVIDYSQVVSKITPVAP